MSLNTHSLSLNGSSQYASRADTASLSITGDFTIEAWCYLDQKPSTAGHHMAIYSKYDYSAGDREYLCEFRSDTDDLTVYYSSDGANTTKIESNSAVGAGDTGTWVHWAMAVDVSAKTATCYKNGSSVGASYVSGTQTSVRDGASAPTIGANDEGRADFFDGLIDEVRVWNDIRTSGEISANYNTQLVGDEVGLVGYWRLNNDYTDETSNGNDMSGGGSPTFSTSVPFPGSPDTARRYFSPGIWRAV